MKRKACAKINLTLNIINKRDDGYHNIESVFKKISLYDYIKVRKYNKDKFYLKVNDKILEKNNIITKAYYLLKEQYPIIKGMKVDLKKKIPTEAGLGGGSSDCATFIKMVNELYNLNMNNLAMINIGLKLGSDVPPFLLNDTLFVQGKGAQITKITDKTKLYLIILKPSFSFSTKNMYELYQKSNLKQKYNSKKMIKHLKNNNIKEVCLNIYNVFEDLLYPNDAYINIYKDIHTTIPLAVSLCGSGSCVFAVYSDKKICNHAYKKLKRKYKVFKCSSI